MRQKSDRLPPRVLTSILTEVKVFYRHLSILLVLVAAPAFAGDSVRTTKKLGLAAALFTEPFPSFWGMIVSYNLNDFLRLSAGWGSINYSDKTLNISATAIGGDVKVFIPKTRLSPFATIGYTSLSGTRTGTGTISTLGNVTPGEAVVTFGGGVDFQAPNGLNIGFEFKANSRDSTFIPGGYVGYFFK